MKKDFSPFDSTMWRENIEQDKENQLYRQLFDWIAEHPGLIATVTGAASFLLLLWGNAFQCGRALFFGVPISEVPSAISIEKILVGIILASFFLISNFLSYKTLQRAHGVCEIARTALFQVGVSVVGTVLLILLIIFLAFRKYFKMLFDRAYLIRSISCIFVLGSDLWHGVLFRVL